MSDDKVRRGFTVSQEAWYARSEDNPEISFGDYPEGGGTRGEMMIRWHKLSGRLTPRLECFDDAWMVLSTFHDVIDAIGVLNGSDPAPDKIAKMLLNLGFEDMTVRENPHGGPRPRCPKCNQELPRCQA